MSLDANFLLNRKQTQLKERLKRLDKYPSAQLLKEIDGLSTENEFLNKGALGGVGGPKSHMKSEISNIGG
jgi:hypothetical protein